jgi:hypothetical protein
LLRSMEQARRSTMAHHVHRIAPMGARVLINGTWYKALYATRSATSWQRWYKGNATCRYLAAFRKRLGVYCAVI